MKIIHFLNSCLIVSLFGFLNSAQASKEFKFEVTVPKNTCDITVDGTSLNKVDFGNIPMSKFKNEVPQGNVKLAFDVKLSNCKNNTFSGSYISLTGNYIEEFNGFLDDAGKEFAIRISPKSNATQGDTDFYTNVNNKIWTNIDKSNMSKTYYAYVMCKTGETSCASNANTGDFKATLTLTFVSD